MIHVMNRFISESITPIAGQFDSIAMGRGEPGLPAEFEWRGRTFKIVKKQDQWKQSSPEGRRAGAEVYLRRHYYKLLMSDSSVWTVYFVRQSPRSGSTKRRWFLYGIS